ncbi:hypothetical protein HOY80DRAFT_1009690 [Tuber brumale]|nr:hypothetical protein HOY80DRAFT_1009690 [Tuber brumale]
MWCRLSEATPQNYIVATRRYDPSGFVLRLSGSSSFVFIQYPTLSLGRGSILWQARHASHASLRASGLWHKLLSFLECAGLLCFRRCDDLLRLVIAVMDMVMAL